MNEMKYFFLFALFLFPIGSEAFSPEVTEIVEPYDIVTVDYQPNEPIQYLGELEEYPVMYEVTSEESFTLSVQLSQIKRGDEPIDFSLIAIRKNDRGGGVSEVGRQQFDASAWTVEKDPQTGLTFWRSPIFANEVEPGTYRVEVSTPKNQGRYLVQFGSGEDIDGYFQSLAGVRRTQQFFGYSIVNMLTSRLVYYPLGMLMLLFIIQCAWRYRTLLRSYAS